MVDEAAVRRRLFIPEVIQTSAMDCGPAALKALFAGFGVYLSYGRLREACQTDVDGTSIDTLEELAQQLGMNAAQMMLPADLMLRRASRCLPAIVVVRLPGGGTHFVVVWRVCGNRMQVMDPAAGRLWMERERFLESVYVHEQTVNRAEWAEWAQSDVFVTGLEERMRALGMSPALWDDLARQDAALRMTSAQGRDKRFLMRCREGSEDIPAEYWTARALDEERVLLRGAVLLSAAEGLSDEVSAEGLPRSLQAVLNEPPPRVWSPVWEALRQGGILLPAALGAALVLAAAGASAEALLFRSFLDLEHHLAWNGQRLGAAGALLLFCVLLLGLEWISAAGLLRLGREIEIRLRARFLLKIPRLGDSYFQSRLISDMAYRAHSLHLLRQLPEVAGRLARISATLLVTAAAIAWLYPGSALLAASIVAAACLVPILFQPAMTERDLRFREVGASLNRFYLDALLGLEAIRAHGAERAMTIAQAGQLQPWIAAGIRQQSLVIHAETLQWALTLGLAVWMVYQQAQRAGDPSGLLLLLYWSISLTLAGRQLAAIAWALPAMRNTLLRFLEPLGCEEENRPLAAEAEGGTGVAIEMDDVTVSAGGHHILKNITLSIGAGEHVAIVGRSGSGKSSLAGLLLGWHRPALGRIRVDGMEFDAEALTRLRRETAWIDPQVYLFRGTLFDNVAYGNGREAASGLAAALDGAGLTPVLGRMPEGMQTCLGEAGRRVSGGEGQRVRIGRAWARAGVRLAILDEPARGLEREERQRLAVEARARFAGATILCITHDIESSLDFDRVLVIEEGRIVEDGDPAELRARGNSRYRELLEREASVRRRFWGHRMWRRFRLDEGALRKSVEVAEWSDV